MIEKLDFLVRFWELKARNDSLGEPLGPREQLELLSLMQLVTGGIEPPPMGPVERPKGALPAQMIGDGAILGVEIRAVTAAAVVVSCASTLSLGAHVILRSSDAVTGVEYALPCSVLWVYKGSPSILALAVDGIPTRKVFAGVPQPRMSAPLGALGMGKHVRLVG